MVGLIRKERYDKLPHFAPLQQGERVRKRNRHPRKEIKCRTFISDEIYVVVRAPSMTGGKSVRRKASGNNTTFKVIESELKRCEEEVIDEVLRRHFNKAYMVCTCNDGEHGYMGLKRDHTTVRCPSQIVR